jgi:hypothetical protein
MLAGIGDCPQWVRNEPSFAEQLYFLSVVKIMVILKIPPIIKQLTTLSFG